MKEKVRKEMTTFITQPRLITSGDYKREAKAQLSGKWKDAVLVALLPGLIVFLMTLFITWSYFTLFSDSGFNLEIRANSGTNSLSNFASNALTIHMMTSVSFTFLDLIRNVKQEINPLKDAFRNFKGRYLWKILLLYLVRYALVFLWTLLLIIPGIIKSYSYSQCYFIMYDELNGEVYRDVGIMECITKSRQMMKGHKMELFLLQLSFIGWYLLSIITFGLALLWVIPYQTMAEAAFYENLRMKQVGFDPSNPEHFVDSEDNSQVGLDPNDFSDF